MVETRKRRIGLIYIELYYWTSISFLSILEGRAILSQLVEFGSEISLESYGILRLIDVPYFAQGIVIHIFLRDAHLALGLLPKFHVGLPWMTHSRLFSCSKIFTIAEIFWIFLFLFFLTHTLILFYNNMIFNILSSKITFILFLLLSSRILFLASFASIISIKQFRTNQTHQISNVKDPRLITINDKKKKKKKRKEKTFNPKQSSENNPNFCNQFIFKITKFPYLFPTFPFHLLDTFHPPYPEL